jgi:radical SAM/Cys-rich protein
MRDTWLLLEPIPFPAIRRGRIETLQVNVGYRCNQSCVHCHVNAGPNRSEEMDGATIDLVLSFLERRGIATLDVTGGAPELNRHFRRLVQAARDMGVRVMDRCNLTILEVPGQEDLAQFLAAQQVEIVASMPCYLLDNVDRQRGKGVFEGSIRGLKRLNALGYGRDETGLVLNLVYNPQGPSLPPAQGPLEADYKRVLGEEYGIVFNKLFTLANMPIQRFGSMLISKGQFDTYLALLRAAHRDENLAGVMCRSLMSVDYRGYVYDCDFNQMLDLPLTRGGRERVHLSELLDEDIAGNPIRVAGHCFGCTAGQGSSCGGALKEAAE